MPPSWSRSLSDDEVGVAAPSLLLPEGALLVRIAASGPGWAAALPAVPGGGEVTVTLGRPELLPVDTGAVRARGYRIIGTASSSRPIGDIVDLLVPPTLRAEAPGWWEQVVRAAQRVFDPGLGPVQRLLEAELQVHMRALASRP